MKKAVMIVLLNQNYEVLCVSRKDNHTDFGLIGGKLEPEDNNNPITAAIRETKEETGLDIFNLELIYQAHREGVMGYTYLANYSGVINTTEPHIVKWGPFSTIINNSSFSVWNYEVYQSLVSMRYPVKLDNF